MPKAGEGAANTGSCAGFTLLMGNGSSVRECESALHTLQSRLETSAGVPFDTVARRSELHCSSIESHSSAGYGKLYS